MTSAYALATVVVSASREPEAFGRVIVEAQAMGRPVVVTNHGAVAETVIAGETAWVVPPADPERLAAALAAALALTPAERDAFAARAIAHVGERFTKDRMAADTLATYFDLVGT